MKRVRVLVCLAVFCFAISVLPRTNGKTSRKEGAPAKTITLTNFQFAPKSITIKADTTLTWLNKEGTHTVTADDGSWESPTLKAGESFSHKFDKAGTYAYHCAFHGASGGSNMAGSVKVIK